MKYKILIIEDDMVFATMLKGWFSRNGYDATFCSKISDAKKELGKDLYNLVLSDLRLPDGEGIELLQWVKQHNIEVPFIIMTSYAHVQSAVAAMKLGAEDYIEKPIVAATFKEKIEQVFLKSQNSESKNINREADSPKEKKSRVEPKKNNKMVMGNSAAALLLSDHIMRVAPTRMSVLILGESGTGKEHTARMIHDNSPRRDKPYIALDCGSLSKELAPSELFGHLKGSFTSAVENKKGVFLQASGGTLFLDEVGNLPYEVQMQLLRTLQEQKVRPVGSVEDIDIDVRIIAATNENLNGAIFEGGFREDLYHRLNEFSLHVPSLRERVGDIPLFADNFLQQANDELERCIKGFTPDAMDILLGYHWSGNLRELRNVVRRAVLFASNYMIAPNDILLTSQPQKTNLALVRGDEKQQIQEALQRARGNKSVAAQLLEIDRKTLYNKMHQLGIKL